MSFYLRKIFTSSFKRLGYACSLLQNERQLSSCSNKRTSSAIQQHIPNHNPVAGSPVLKETIGQPTHLTHPHKLLEGEILPGIKKDEFHTRRSKLVHNIDIFASKSDFKKNSHLIVIPSSQKKYMTEQIPYIFRQNTDFLYLTGCMEPDSILVIASHGSQKHESILFLRGKDPHSELWDGPRTGIDQASEVFGIDKALPLDAFEAFITSYIKEHTECMLWYDYGNVINPNVHTSMKNILTQHSKKICESPKPLIHRLRLYKSPAEQELMKKSCEICANAVKTTIKNSKPWDNEAHIFARVDYECRMNGAEYLAYPPVVAGGNRANIIHYINNDQIIEEGDLVLMDAGCEYRGYSSDVTRTWPISGKFSGTQRVLYEVVYTVQKELIAMCNEFPSLDRLFNEMCRLLGIRLKEAGVLSIKLTESDLAKVAFAFCPHHVSHYLGMDVHDTSTISGGIFLEPGMILTVEPGVYVNRNNKLSNPEFRGHGIRIEDDILMTSTGPLILTSSCPKHPDEIEKLWSSKGNET